MATYKVAQDVEADDKLLGPFTFRQFIYLIIVALAGFVAYGLSKIFVGLIFIPLPVILFFGALALPLRKDQPMETYLAAMISFYLKPRKRLWKPDGLDSLIEITVPKEIEVQRTKDLSQSEASQRFSYLANIADTGGWAVRNVTSGGDTSMLSDVYNEAQQATDPLDTTSSVAQSFNTMISQADQKRHDDMMARMQQTVADPAAVAPATTPQITQPTPGQFVINPTLASMLAPQAPVQADSSVVTPPPAPEPDVTFNPYPTIHQSVVQPLAANDQVTAAAPEPTATPDPSQPAAESTSDTTVSPDIINLASNTDLSIETIAREAQRIKEKDAGDSEVFISLR